MAPVTIETVHQVRGGSLRDVWSIKKRELVEPAPGQEEPLFLKLSCQSYGLRHFIMGDVKESLAGSAFFEELKTKRNSQQDPATAVACVFGSSAKKKKRKTQPRSSDDGAEAQDPWLEIALPRVMHNGEAAGPISIKVLRSSKQSAPAIEFTAENLEYIRLATLAGGQEDRHKRTPDKEGVKGKVRWIQERESWQGVRKRKGKRETKLFSPPADTPDWDREGRLAALDWVETGRLPPWMETDERNDEEEEEEEEEKEEDEEVDAESDHEMKGAMGENKEDGADRAVAIANNLFSMFQKSS